MLIPPKISLNLLESVSGEICALDWHSDHLLLKFSPQLLIVQEKEGGLGKGHHHRGGGGQLSSGGPLGSHPASPDTPAKQCPETGAMAGKKCELKTDCTSFSSPKLKVEPGDSPHDSCGGLATMSDAELAARRLVAMTEAADHLSPRKDGSMVVGGGHYGVGKEECLPHGHSMTMSMEPNLHHLAPGEQPGTCNSFSVDSIMTTSREGSPVSGQHSSDPVQLPPHSGSGGYRPVAPWGGHSPTYPTCLYPGAPGQTSLEELSSMTAACLSNQTQMSSLYSRPSWYTMPGHHSPNNIGPSEPTFPQSRDYFEPLGKAPSPLPAGCAADQMPYRSPTYRTNYYQPQDCEKY